jgi:hypothetical protein
VSAPPAGQRFGVLPGVFAVCRLAPGEAVPAWVTGEFASVTRTPDELSIICPAERVPLDVRADRDWRVLKIAGPFAFSTVGVLASLAAPLAQAGISLLTISTYDTDYLLVKHDALERAVAVLGATGHQLVG